MTAFPKKIIVRRGALKTAGAALAEFSKPFVVANADLPAALIKQACCDAYERLLVSRATYEQAVRVLQSIRRTSADVVVGLGGGTPIDVAKYAASQAGIEFVSIPTCCANDGLVSPVASLKDGGASISVNTGPPSVVLADIDIIRRAPYRLTAAGVGDVLGKQTALWDWRLAVVENGEAYDGRAALLCEKACATVGRNVAGIRKQSVRGISVLVEALVASGLAMCLAGSSRPASGSEHKFSHALDEVAGFPALHGEQVAVGTILAACLQEQDWEKLRQQLVKAGCPTTACELGVRPAQVVQSLLKARMIRPERYTVFERERLDRTRAAALAAETEVI